MDDLKMLAGDKLALNQYITVRNPTLAEIKDFGEEKYYSTISVICSTPSDFKSTLYDKMGIDWEQMSDFNFFCIMCAGLPKEQTSLIFGDLDFQKLKPEASENGTVVLKDKSSELVIDEAIYIQITNYLRKVHGLKRNHQRAGNETTKRYLLDKDRRLLARNKHKQFKSILAPLISSMTNICHYKHDSKTVWNESIYTFMDSVNRVQLIVNYILTMQGAYTGNIDIRKIKQNEIYWMKSTE